MHIKTKHLIIREFTMDDLPDLSRILAIPEVMRFSLKGTMTIDETQDFLEKRILDHYASHGYGLWALIDKHNNRMIGYAGLINQTIDAEQLVELGYRLDPHYWGKGLATEAANAIVEHAFQKPGMDKLISIIDPQNIRSIEVAKRAGMRFLKKSVYKGIPVHIYEIQKVCLEPYDMNWPAIFEQEKQKLQTFFKGIEITFHHIGSTSIKGCAAKPIIDILGITSDITLIDQFIPAMEELGFASSYIPPLHHRRFFVKRSEPSVNLHLFEESDPEVDRHMRFRDYLNAHSQKTSEYVQLKEQLAQKFPHDICSYCLGKENFVKSIDYSAAMCILENTRSVSKTSKKRIWTANEISQALEANMHLQMTYFAKYLPTREIVFQPDVTVIRSHPPKDAFNFVLGAQFTEINVNERVGSIANLYQRKKSTFSWCISERDTPSTLDQTLESYGFTKNEDVMGLYRDLYRYFPLNTSHALSIRRVLSKEQLRDFTKVVLELGGDWDALDMIYDQIPVSLYHEGAPLEIYVAYKDNVPIMTGMLVLHANVAGIYYLATVPGERNQGYGTVLMDHLMAQAKAKGYHMATLQAAASNTGIYERMGFKSCCKFYIYDMLGMDS